ncbi:MAG: hypothetical protein JSV24_06615 [Bacteroidales bacterium]|nr:MAG: hypothetical protein JSV24_06615 [Bacteroidales bacterium]
MKKFCFLVLTILFSAILFTGCEKDPDPSQDETSILPESFKVDIPDAISRESIVKKSAPLVDTLQGNEIYEHLSNFIAIGEGAADIVQEIIFAIAVYGINKPMYFPFEGDDDGRIKNLEVVENSSFDGASWEFQLTITDAESESNADGGKAIQVFWNRNPVKGIAVLKPYNIDRTHHLNAADAIFRIDYSEAGERGYDAHMIVYIAGLPLANPLVDPFSMSALKMFAGKKGDVIDVYGNSNHPNARFFTDNSGFNWAFVASGDEILDIGVAEVGLPPSSLDEPSRNVLLDYYSIENVFSRQIYEWWPTIDPATVAAYLYNTAAPGYFDSKGFVQGGTSPGAEYDDIEGRLPGLSPYNPKEISNLSISFKE